MPIDKHTHKQHTTKMNNTQTNKQLTFTSLGCECFTQQWLHKTNRFNKLVNIFSLTREYDKHASDINRDDFIFNVIEYFDEFKQLSLETAKQGNCPKFGYAWYSEDMNWKIHYRSGYDVSTYFDNLYKADVYLYAFRNYTKERGQILVKFIKSLNQDARIILFSDKFNETPIRENGIIYINSDIKNIVHQCDKKYAKENSQLWNYWFLLQNEFNAYTFLWKNMPNNMKDFDSSNWIKTI